MIDSTILITTRDLRLGDALDRHRDNTRFAKPRGRCQLLGRSVGSTNMTGTQLGPSQRATYPALFLDALFRHNFVLTEPQSGSFRTMVLDIALAELFKAIL